MDWRKRKRFVESCGCVHGEPHTCALVRKVEPGPVPSGGATVRKRTKRIDEIRASGDVNLGRALANCAATMWQERAEKAEADLAGLLRHLPEGETAEHNVLTLLDLYHERAVKAERECEVLRAFNGDPVALDSRRAREKARLAAAERVVEAARPLAESNPHAECDEEACRLGRFINARDAKYLAWLRTLPCCACHRPPPSEASHHGRRGIGLKASDHEALPLCSACHRAHHDQGSIPLIRHLEREERRTWLWEQAERYRALYLGAF